MGSRGLIVFGRVLQVAATHLTLVSIPKFRILLVNHASHGRLTHALVVRLDRHLGPRHSGLLN